MCVYLQDHLHIVVVVLAIVIYITIIDTVAIITNITPASPVIKISGSNIVEHHEDDSNILDMRKKNTHTQIVRA